MRFIKVRRWMQQTKIMAFVGLAGVDKLEPRRTRLWGDFFNYFVVLVSISLLAQWQAEINSAVPLFQRWAIDSAILLFFVVEYTVLICLVRDRRRFLRQNWLLPLIILCGVAIVTQQSNEIIVLRAFRPVLAIVILAPAIGMMIRFFVDGKLKTTLFAAAIIVVIFGIVIAGVDPGIPSIWDGIWWAIVTVSTVGYGDVVPTSGLGRLIGAGLIVLGLGIFVVITANFLALILRKDDKVSQQEQQKLELITTTLLEIQRSQEELGLILKTLGKRLRNLEDRGKE